MQVAAPIIAADAFLEWYKAFKTRETGKRDMLK